MNKEVETKLIDNIIYIRGKCSCCKQCWIDLKKGTCLYGGPFNGYDKDKDFGTPEDKPLPPVQS